MLIQFKADDVDEVMSLLPRFTATERASMVHHPVTVDGTVWVDMELTTTTLEELRGFMERLPDGKDMADSLKEIPARPGVTFTIPHR